MSIELRSIVRSQLSTCLVLASAQDIIKEALLIFKESYSSLTGRRLEEFALAEPGECGMFYSPNRPMNDLAHDKVVNLILLSQDTAASAVATSTAGGRPAVAAHQPAAPATVALLTAPMLRRGGFGQSSALAAKVESSTEPSASASSTACQNTGLYRADVSVSGNGILGQVPAQQPGVGVARVKKEREAEEGDARVSLAKKQRIHGQFPVPGNFF